MDLIILHYHLNRGGVTRVIENHLRALAQLSPSEQPSRAIVVYGGRAADWDSALGDVLPFPLHLVAIPELDYDEQSSDLEKGDLLDVMRKMLATWNCEAEATILHVHNHSLGKNARWPNVLTSLADDGWRLLLQIHDFAEDLRPHNYGHLVQAAGNHADLHAGLYPQAPQIHYATLNQRDHSLLLGAGLAEDRLHRIPNPVVGGSVLNGVDREVVRAESRSRLQTLHGIPPEQTYVLYPVRGIRRKNLGEFLLWASLFEDATFAMTLPPINPRELPTYESWKHLATELALPVLFEAGQNLSLDDNYAAADAIVTTSVAEGFGMAFLEAAWRRRPIVGRDLPDITADFRAAGMEFPGLASSMWIPADWIDLRAARQTMLRHAKNLRADYGVAPSDDNQLEARVAELYCGEVVDFGRLSSGQQAIVIREIHRVPQLTEELKSINPTTRLIDRLSLRTDDASSIQQPARHLEDLDEMNAKVIEQHYSLSTIGDRLRQIYSKLQHSERGAVLSKQEIGCTLQLAFLDPQQIYPIRLET